MKNLINKVTMEWLKAAAIRAIRTMAQTALGIVTIGAAINEINWMQVASVAVVAGVFSILTSLSTTLPEVGTDGVLQIDTSGEKDVYSFEFNNELPVLATKSQVTFKVNTAAKLSQE